MQIRETKRNDVLVVEPVGRLDSSTARTLDRALSAAVQRGDRSIVLDCQALDYVGSMGLSVLLAAAKRAKAAHGTLRICRLNERVRLVFEMSGFLRLFDVADNY